MDIWKNGGTPAAFGSALRVFAIVCTVYSISVLDIYVRRQLEIFVTLLVSTGNIPCKKIVALSKDILFVVHILLGRITVTFSIDFKYRQLLKNVTGLCPL